MKIKYQLLMIVLISLLFSFIGINPLMQTGLSPADAAHWLWIQALAMEAKALMDI